MLFASYTNLAVVESADFDGTNDFMARGAGLTGAADSKSGIFSLWIRTDARDGTLRGIFNLVTTLGGGTGRFNVIHLAANTFRLFGANAAGSTILQLTSNTAYAADATWRHFLLSWDLAAAAGHLYVNDADDLAAGSTLTNDTIDYTVADSGVGALPDASAKSSDVYAELYFAPGQYLDFSVLANRRKFISSSGKPMFLGVDGALPTGTAPIVYFHLGDGEAVASFATNRGPGGDYAITGTLVLGSTSPSD